MAPRYSMSGTDIASATETGHVSTGHGVERCYVSTGHGAHTRCQYQPARHVCYVSTGHRIACAIVATPVPATAISYARAMRCAVGRHACYDVQYWARTCLRDVRYQDTRCAGMVLPERKRLACPPNTTTQLSTIVAATLCQHRRSVCVGHAGHRVARAEAVPDIA
eukprot:1766116-Rhodomonas_salina.2